MTERCGYVMGGKGATHWYCGLPIRQREDGGCTVCGHTDDVHLPGGGCSECLLDDYEHDYQPTLRHVDPALDEQHGATL